MRNGLKKAAWLAGAILGVLVLLVLGFVIFANTEPGRSAVVALLNPLLGGNVTIKGLSGRFPDAPTAEHVEISDEHGVWLRLDRVSARWSPLQLLRNRISAHSISAESATLVRWPIPDKSPGSSPPMDFKRVTIGRLTIAPGIVAHAVVVSLNGAAYYTSDTEFAGNAHIRRLDAAGEADIRGRLRDSDLTGSVTIREPGNGIVAGMLGFPNLGPLSIDAHANGPRTQNRIAVVLAAGALRTNAQGTIDLLHKTAALSFSAASPVMSLRQNLSWHSLALNGWMRGAFAAPDVSAHVELLGFEADGGSVRSVSGDVQGRHGDLYAAGKVESLRIPGSHPDLLADAPIVFEAHALLGASTRTIDLTLSHRLLAISGHLVTDANTEKGVFQVKFPSLGPIAAAEDIDAQGRAEVNATVTVRAPASSIAVNGSVHFAAGSSTLVRLIGSDARFAGQVTAKDGAVTIDEAAVEATGASANASGTWSDGSWDLRWSAALNDLSRLASTLNGRVALRGNVRGRSGMMAVNADGGGDVATKGFASGPLRIALRAQGLPLAPSGTIDVSGKLDSAPLAVSAKLSRSARGDWKFVLERADWKSVRAQGSLVAPAMSASPSGKVDVHVDRLGDLQPLLGELVGGKLDATADFIPTGAKAHAHVLMVAQGLSYGDARIGIFRIAGDISDPLKNPSAALAYSATGFADDQVAGNLNGTISGPQNAVAVTLDSDLRESNGQTVRISGSATTDIPKSQLTLSRYDIEAAGQSAHLLAPAHFNLAGGIAVDALRVAAGASEFDVAGRLAPRLDATFELHNGTASLLRPFYPNLSVAGTLSGSAKLSGTLAAPLGTLTINGKSLQVGMDVAAAVPPIDLAATAVLHGTTATVHAMVHSGSHLQLTIAGDTPLRPNGTFNLHVSGTEDLAILDPVLNAEGRSLHGALVLDGQMTGTLARPRAAGSAQLSKGEFQDYVRGIHLSAISASFDARGDTIDINSFSARAGDGSITGKGSIDLAAPGEPVSLTVVAINAKPVSNSVLNASLDANLKIAGRFAEQFTLSGNVDVRRGEIDIPDSLPAGVAVLTLRGKEHPPPPPPISIALDLNLRSNGQLFVRGHGVDAEMSGKVHIGGTTLAPDVTGGFDLRRGNLSLAGQTLNFTSGQVSFDGSSLRERVDPSLDLVAQTTSAGTSATLTVGGHASLPKITLTSTPPLPQDEVLAHLLFGQSASQLSPWQIAQLGQALASLGGMGGLGDPLTRVRKSLGLDRLAVTTAGATGSDTAVEAGRYVARNIYVGAKQGVSGAGGTQAIVQVDLTKHLKLQTQISTNNAPTPVAPGTTPVDTGSNLGLSYQFEY
jgi:translocation and assembly module TamB